MVAMAMLANAAGWIRINQLGYLPDAKKVAVLMSQDEATITEIAKQKPYYFIMRDSSLATDNVADNFEQIWEEYSKDTIRRII